MDLCHRIGDGIHSTPVYSNNGECHFINGNNLSNGTIKIEPTTKRVDLEEAKKHQRPLSDDTILLSINGTIGNIAFYRHEQVILGKSACYINVDDSAANKRYIYSFLGTERVRYYFESELTGSTIRNLSLAAIRSLHLSLPTLPEQRKIADFLTAVDGRIGQLIQKKVLLEDYKKGMMRQLFTQAIRFKDDHGNDFPDWEEKKLGEVGKITTGKTPNTSDADAWIGETMFVTPSDIGEDTKFQNSTSRHVNGEKLRLIPEHSLMFTCIASVGKMSIATEPCITNQQINSISVSSDFHFEYVYYALRNLTPRIKATQANTTLPIINKTEFSKFILSIPSSDEQTKIANFLSAIDRKIQSVATQITETQTFKRGLLQQMFV